MSGRKLGGGRILGSGRGIGPPPSAPSSQAKAVGGGGAEHVPGKRAVSPFAPSESTLSLGNSSSASGSVADAVGDLMSYISLAGPSQADTARNTLSCPICEEDMVTLLQLNRHLDDAHQELPPVEQDEVKTWFNKQVLKAKRFQPLSVLNQKLRGLDVFESNESGPISPSLFPTAAAKRPGLALVEGVIDPDELIARSHWQRPTSTDLCTDPACGKRLGALNGTVNCRGCGKLFCEEHTMYQMKLSRAAKHDPARGYWARVCETCFKSRAGYNDHHGVTRDHTAEFKKTRARKMERGSMDTARLEKRLTKLTRLLADPPPGAAGGSLLSPVTTLARHKNPRKMIEQSVVAWEDDASVAKCPFCRQEFGSWTFRRHHCRICGRVVCADPETACSTEVGLNVAPASHASPATEKPGSPMPRPLAIDVRICRDCNYTIFSKRDFDESLLVKPPDQRAYETLRQFEKGIRLLMPGFQKALSSLRADAAADADQDGIVPAPPSSRPPPTQAQLQDAAKIRKRLVDAFAKYGATAKRLRDLQTDSPTQQLLQTAVFKAASSFLHVHMLPLKSVPQMLRNHKARHQNRSHLGLPHASSASSLSPLRNGQSVALSSDAGDAASQASGTNASVSTALESEERELKERLVVLEEQRFLIGQMVTAARGARRFEEVGALARNAEELDGEIACVKALVGSVEERWEGLFRDGVAATATAAA